MKAPGEPVGKGILPHVADELGLRAGTAVATSMIDAHAGGIGKHVCKCFCVSWYEKTSSRMCFKMTVLFVCTYY